MMSEKTKIVRKFLSLPNTSGITEVKIGFFNRSRIEFVSSEQKYLSLKRGSHGSRLYILSYTGDLLRLKSPNGRISIRIADVDDFINSDDMSLVLKYGRDILDENLVSNIKEGLNVSDFDAFLNQ